MTPYVRTYFYIILVQLSVRVYNPQFEYLARGTIS